MTASPFFSRINIASRIVELIILFIAVTLGFVVENYREDYSEKKNSIELLNSLKIDLEKDLERFDDFTARRKVLIENVYLFIDDVTQRGLLRDDFKQQNLFANAIFNWSYFNPNVANIEQVISSGALRYLGNDALKNQIGVLESKSIAINDRQEREQEYFLNYLQPLMHQYYNFKWINTTYVRKWDTEKNQWGTYEEALKNILKLNPSQKDLMFWKNDPNLQSKLINLFENYVFILRSSYVVNFEAYLTEVKKTITTIEDNINAQQNN